MQADEPSLWNAVVAKVVSDSWENNITGPEESVQHMICALAEDIGTLRGYKKYKSKDYMGTKWGAKERESCMLLEIMTAVVKRQSILGKVCLLGEKEIQQNEFWINFFSEMVSVYQVFIRL